MDKNMEDHGVRFGGGGGASIAGVLGGVAIALGVPFIILNYGQALPQSVLTYLVIGGVAAGGLISLVSAFFGVVMPSHVSGWEDYEWGDWQKKKKEKAPEIG